MPESPVVSRQPVDGGRRRGPAVAVRPRSAVWPGPGCSELTELVAIDQVTHKHTSSLYLSKITDNSTG